MMDYQEDEIKPENLSIHKKGQEIFNVVKNICDLFPEENERLQYMKGQLLADAAMLTIKVGGAEAGGLYDLKMEAAAIIREAARDLLVQNHTLTMLGFKHTDYFNIVRNLIEEYRLLFINWVAGFEKWDYVIDRWGLFNPPGVGPFDKDPDDNIPFDFDNE